MLNNDKRHGIHLITPDTSWQQSDIWEEGEKAYSLVNRILSYTCAAKSLPAISTP